MFYFLYKDNDWCLDLNLNKPNMIDIWYNEEYFMGSIHLNKEIIYYTSENDLRAIKSLLKSKEFEQAFKEFKKNLKVSCEELILLLEKGK